MSNGIGPNPLNPLSKIYLEQVGKKKKDDTYLEPDMKKRQDNNEKARKDLMKGPQMKNPHFEQNQQGWESVNALADAYKAMQEGIRDEDPEKGTAERKARLEKKRGMKMDDHPQYKKEEVEEVSEAGMHRDAKTGEIVDKAEVGKTYYPNMPKKKSSVALRKEKMKEGLDPVGQEDADIDNDGDTDKSDKYLHKRRKAIGKAIKKKMSEQEEKIGGGNLKKLAGKATKRIDADNDGDVDEDDPKEKGMGEFVPSADGKKKVRTTAKFESYSWRQDLSEIMTDDIDSKPIKEKKVNNKININPKLGEAVEEMGGTLIEMVEIDEFDYIIESVYDELAQEGYEEDDIEEVIEYALTEATVTFGHDTDKPHQKDTSTGGKIKAIARLAKQKLKSAGKKVRLKSAQAQVAAYNKGREVAQTAGDKARRAKKVVSDAGDKVRRAKKAVSDAPQKAKSGIKSRIKKAAQKVVDRMSEEVVDETYTVTAADKKGNTPAYQAYKAGKKKKDGTPMYKAADHMKEGVRDVDPEKGTAERKAKLEKKRGMKLDDHPQYKKEEVEQVDENRAAMGRINKEYHRKKEAEAMAARARDPKVKRDLPKRKNDNPMYDPKSAGSSRVKGFKFTGEEVEHIDEIIDPKGAARIDAAKKKNKVDVFAYDRKLQAQGKLKGKKLPPPPTNEEVEIEEGIVDTLKGAAKGAKKGVEKARKFQQAPYKAVDRMQRMTRHKQDKYGPSTLKQRVMTGADHNIDNERKAKMKTEEASMSPQEVQLQKKKAMIDKMIATKRMQGLKKSASAEPAKAMGEALSVDDQMRISREYNRMSPEEKKAANKKALGTIKRVKREKDTRTDAQKMTDATGPRPGSRYRGD